MAAPDPRRWVTLAVVVVAALHRGARQLGAHRRHPHDPARLRHDAPRGRVGDHRVRADLRQPADHRRPPRRRVRSSADLHHRRGTLRRRLAPRRGLVERADPHRRRGDHRGHRCVAHVADDPVDHLDHLPRSRARHRVRRLGRDRRRRRRARPRRRRVPHHQLLVAVGVRDQRHRRAAGHHRARSLFIRRDRPNRATRSASTCPAPAWWRSACSSSCSR